MRTVLIIIFSIVFIIQGFSQTIYDTVDPANQNTSLLFGKNLTGQETHYLMEFFNTGTIQLKDGTKMNNIILNYDLLTDNLITKRSEKDFIVEKGIVEAFSFYDPKSSKDFIFKKIKTNDESFFGEEIYRCTKFTIYKRNVLRLQVSAPQEGYGSDNFKDKKYQTDNSTFYLMRSDSVLIEVEKRNQTIKDYISSLNDNAEDSLRAFQKLKINPANQDKIISYFKVLCQ